MRLNSFQIFLKRELNCSVEKRRVVKADLFSESPEGIIQFLLNRNVQLIQFALIKLFSLFLLLELFNLLELFLQISLPRNVHFTFSLILLNSISHCVLIIWLGQIWWIWFNNPSFWITAFLGPWKKRRALLCLMLKRGLCCLAEEGSGGWVSQAPATHCLDWFKSAS